MTKRALPLLTGGLNEITRSDLIDDSQLQQCLNYEIEGDGTLVLRTDPEQFDSTLDILLAATFSSVIKISEPWYPQTLQQYTDESRSDYFLFAFGLTSDDKYELHMLWDKNGTWTNVVEKDNGVVDGDTLAILLTDADVVYTSDSQVEIIIGTERVIITDGINRAHTVALDEDGIVRAGILGIPAPQNKPRVTEMTDWKESIWETDSTASRLSTPGLFQCNYTVVTDIGEESNPSPISDTLDMQFFKLDSDGLDEKWLDKVEIKDLSIPNVPENVLDTLKYFKVYMRVIKYSEGEIAAVMEFTEQFEIISKKDNDGNIVLSGTTGNDYSIIIAPTAGDVVSYENDIAPIAKTGAETGGITMLGNVQTKIKFPWEFKYFHKITVKNDDSKNYVDAVIKIRLWDKDAVGIGTNAIDNFTVIDFVDTDTVLPQLENTATRHIRIFDQDLTTPIMVVYNGYNNTDDVDISGDREKQNSNYIDLYIKIPLLTAATAHIVYLCWTPTADQESYAGVPGNNQSASEDLDESILLYNGLKTISVDSELTWQGNIGIHYGRFHTIGYHGFNRQQVFSGERVKNDGSFLCTPMNLIIQTDKIENKANMNYSGTINSNVSIGSGNTIIPILSGTSSSNLPLVSSYKAIFDSSESGAVSFGTLGVGSTLSGLYLTVYGRIKFDVNEVGFFNTPRYIFDFKSSIAGAGVSLQLYDTSVGGQARWRIGYSGTTHIFDDMGSVADEGVQDYFFLFSINDSLTENPMISVFAMNLQTDSYKYSEFDISSEANLFDITDVNLGQTTPAGYSFKDTEYSQLQMIRYRYYSAESDDDINAVYNLANFMPAFDNMIGFKQTDVSINNNITFDETEEIKFKDNKNLVKWTDVYFTSFPDLFFKKVKEPVLKIMPAPSFLQFEYMNTFIIFTRNSINRFVLDGSADGWRSSSKALIEEKTQYGLLAPDSLVRAGEALFWLSEVGVMMWQKDGLGLISKDIVDIPIEDDVLGFYNNLRNQYIMHREQGSGSSITYVYHIHGGKWTRFTNFDIIDTASLTAGSELDNVNLFLTSTNTIKKYPTATSTTETATIQTKEMFFEKGVLRRVKAGFEGSDVDFISYLKKNDVAGVELTKENTIADIESDKWRGVALANSRGKSVSFEIQNAEKIQSIMYDLDIESEVVV